MKFLFILTLLIMQLSSNEELQSLESIFFKMGLEALINDFEQEKNTTKEQRKVLNDLKNMVHQNRYQINEILKKTNKDENLFNVSKNPINTTNNNLISNKDYTNLKNEIDLLKSQIKTLQNTLKNQGSSITNNKPERRDIKAYANINNLRGRANPRSDASIVKKFNLGESFFIDYCDQYNWCKLKNKEIYVAKYLIRF
jgi:hypothetical protein